MARATQEDILQTARADGKAEGKAEGERDKALQIARSLLQNGLSPALIHETTGLSEAEINALSKLGTV